MNDDRKFKERSEMMRDFFMEQIPARIIAEVTGLSLSTISKDRKRIAKLYGKLPKQVASGDEYEQRYNRLFNNYVRNSKRTRMSEAIAIMTGVDEIERHICSIQDFCEKIDVPHIAANNQIGKAYRELFESYFRRKTRYFISEFYEAIIRGIVPSENLNSRYEVKTAATEYFATIGRGNYNNIIIDDPKAFFDPILAKLSEREQIVLRFHYGLDGEKKLSNEVGAIFGISKARAHTLFIKAKKHLDELLDNNHLLSDVSTIHYYKARCSKLEMQLENTERELQNAKNLSNNVNDALNGTKHLSANVLFLTKKVKDIHLPSRISNKFWKYDYVIDLVENWDDLRRIRSVGKKSISELYEFLLNHDIDIKNISEEDMIIAREIIGKAK
jgi:hypothetical protein